jgi:hypothetical protein
VSLTSTTPSTCSVSGTTLTLLSTGTCIIDASQAGNATYALATTVSRVITISAAPLTAQTISFTGPSTSLTLGTAPGALTATATSGLAVSFASTTPSTCAVSGTTLSLTTAGTCIVDASQAGGSGFSAATTVSRVFTISAATQSISFTGPSTSQTLGTAPGALTASATSGLAVSFASKTAGTCSVSGTTLNLLAVGSCVIDATQAGGGIYAAAATVTRTFTISQASQTITFTSPGPQTLGASVSLSATSSSLLAVTFSSTTLGVCTVSGSTVTLLAVGTCSIDANQAGNTTYAAAATVTRAFSVSAAPLTPQTISFSSPGTQTLGTAASTLSATASSGLAVTLTSSTAGVCTVAGTTLTLVSVGTCIIDANQAGNATYSSAPTVTASFGVLGAAQSISFTGPATSQTLGTAPGALTATATSGLAVTFSTPSSTCSVSGTTLTLLSVGSCTVNANQAGSSFYAPAAAASRVFTIAAASQTISFTGPSTSQTLGTAPGPLVATATSGLPVSFSTTSSTCSVSGTTLTLISVGTCSVNADQAGNSSTTAAATTTRVFTISQATQTISFASPGAQVLGTSPTLSATASSGLTVIFSASPSGVCTVSGNALTLLTAGNCTVTANQPGNATYSAAVPVANTFAVTQASQAITFTSPGTQVLDKATPFAVATPLAASASSGLSVSISSLTPSICTVSGTTLTLLGTVKGTCTLQADQAGNSTYAAAAPVTQSVAVVVELFANGGFESAGSPTPANAWLTGGTTAYTRSSDAHSGGFALSLNADAFGSAVAVQNSIEQGSRPALVTGSVPVLTFWAKGYAGDTGNVLFALRYLDGTGNIKANSGNQFFQTKINPTTWTKITYTLPGGVPAGATAAFIEISQAIGPVGLDPTSGTTFAGGIVLVDDISLQVP